MHLKTLEITNFENQKHNVYNFSPGTNIISGNSDSGKSSAIRAFILAQSNRPSGYEYRSWGLPKKGETSVKVSFDEGEVTRTRSNTKDEYTLKLNGAEEQTFSTLNRQVPEEIQSLFNLKDYNIQPQHDDRGVKKSFFISESPATRAQMLNKISGLEIIDSSLSKVNTIIRENKSDNDKVTKDIKETQDKINKIQFINEADTVLVQAEEAFTNYEHANKMNTILEKYILGLTEVQEVINKNEVFLNCKSTFLELKEKINLFNNAQQQIQFYEKYINNLTEIEEVVNDNSDFLKCKETANSILALIQKRNEVENHHSIIEKLSVQLVDVDSVISHTQVWLDVKTAVSSLTEALTLHRRYEFWGDDIGQWIIDFEKNNDSIKQLNTKIEILRKNKVNFMKSIGNCPLCGSVVK